MHLRKLESCLHKLLTRGKHSFSYVKNKFDHVMQAEENKWKLYIALLISHHQQSIHSPAPQNIIIG